MKGNTSCADSIFISWLPQIYILTQLVLTFMCHEISNKSQAIQRAPVFISPSTVCLRKALPGRESVSRLNYTSLTRILGFCKWSAHLCCTTFGPTFGDMRGEGGRRWLRRRVLDRGRQRLFSFFMAPEATKKSTDTEKNKQTV